MTEHEFLMPWETDLTYLIGLMSAASGYCAYCEKYADNTLLQDVQKTYLNAKEYNQANPRVKYVFEGFAILGKQ